MEDPRLVLDGFPDAVLVLEDDLVQWANQRAHRLLGRTSLLGSPLADLLAPGEFTRLALLRSQRDAGWALPETCRVRFLTESGEPGVLVDMRVGDLGERTTVITARDATEVTRAELLMGRLAERSSGVLMRDENALFDATEQIFIDLKWVVAFTRIVPEGSRVERIIAQANDPVGSYGRTLLGREQPRAATPVLQQVVATRRALFLDNLPTMTQPALPAEKLAASMAASRVARSAWCPIFTPQLTHVLAVTGQDLTEHDFAAIQLFAAHVGATIHLTELRHELVKRERLAAVGQTATVLSHELRTPLAVIFNVVASLKRFMDPLSLPEAVHDQHKALVAMLDEEAAGLQRLVTDLLDFGGLAPPRLEREEVVSVVADALDAAQHDAGWRERAPSVELDPTVPNTEALVDRSQLRRAVHNLLINAAQHVADHGRIRIEVAGREAEVEVRVWNEGPQLVPEVASRMFEPFFTTRPGGTGLGLAITQRICADHGGTVKVEPVASGVSFLMTLPRKPPQP